MNFRRSKIVPSLLFLVFLSGCKTKQSIDRLGPKKATLIPASRIYVAIPEKPGRDEERVYEASHFRTAEACAKAFRQYGKVKLGRHPETWQEALTSARNEGCNYLVKPEIRVWEDNPTEWTGERDELEVDVEIIKTATGETVSRDLLKGRSRWMTLGDKPERMLEGFFEPLAAELFKGKSVN